MITKETSKRILISSTAAPAQGAARAFTLVLWMHQLHNAHDIDSVECRATVSGDARRNTSRYRVNKSADGVLRDGFTIHFQPFAKVGRSYEAGAEFSNGVQ
ncbi:hypothetical protein TNCV_217241 [Trichonephila clavipes]|nr:hypothetical protein TNCV_217241 [Trichonephila clavipes]